MRWKSLCFSKVAVLGLATVFFAGSVAASPLRAPTAESVTASDWDFQKEATGLLGEVKTLAYNLERDANTLSAFARDNGVSWHTHAYYLNSVGGHINQINERLDRLQAIKHVTAPWQQQAVDRVVPISAEIAGRAQAAIDHLSDNRLYRFADSYRDHLAAIVDRSGDLSDSVGQFIDYGRTQQRMERLQQHLEIVPL